MREIKNHTKRKANLQRSRCNPRTRFVFDGFVYHNTVIAGNPPLRYLGCSEHKKLGCRGRALLPLGAPIEQIRITQTHNHPPDVNAQEKFTFINELRKAIKTMEKATLKSVYETVAHLYPIAASELPFRSLCSSLHRWRHNPNL